MKILEPLHEKPFVMSRIVILAHLSHSFVPSRFFVWSASLITSSKFFVAPNLLEGLHTLYLFTKSDFKTILLPVTVFAGIMASPVHLDRLPQVMFWIWLHLLQFCVSNQSISPEEDAVNKPWRPIPSGRITVSQARTFRWCIAVACLALSAYLGVIPASLLILSATFAYNDIGFHAQIVMRNVCNALGYGSFELGATQLAGDLSVKPSTMVALIVSTLIIFTTIHAADFRDVKGDRLEGKKTLPIVYPECSRILMLASLLGWSGILGGLWALDLLLALTLFAIGAVVGFRFMWRRDVIADRKSYLLYNLWLSLAHVSLGEGQFRGWLHPSSP